MSNNQKKQKKKEWNESYLAGGNILFYPHEEIVRFVNKYVRKRVGGGINEFRNLMDLPDAEWDQFKSLDLGCGIGRHMKFLDESGLNPYGIDLSDEAVEIGKSWLTSIGRKELADKISVGSAADLPYDDETFYICVSHGTLDSMPRDIGVLAMQEAVRVLKKGGMMYVDLILDPDGVDRDELVEIDHEKGTIQSYFSVEGIKKFVGIGAEIIDFKIITWTNELGRELNRRAHIIIRRKF